METSTIDLEKKHVSSFFKINIDKNIFKRNLFIFTFLLIIVLKCLNLTELEDFIPYSTIYFIYILLSCALIVFDFLTGKIKIKKLSFTTKVCLFLIIYYTVWFLYGARTINASDAFNNYAREILLVLFIYSSVHWITKYNCLNEIIKGACVVLFVYLLFSFILYLNEIDLVRTIHSFWQADSSLRYRINFGFRYNNIAAELALSTLFLSKKLSKRKLNIIIDIFMFIIIIANNSRGTLVLTVFMELLFHISYKYRLDAYKLNKIMWRTLIVSIVVVWLYCYKTSTEIWDLLSFTNRQGVTENIAILRANNKWLLGLGRLTGGFFAERNYVNGLQTGYLEVFYYEIFVTSGFLGLALMFLFIYWICNVTSKKSKKNIWFFMVIIYSLIISLFEVYLFSYIYASSMLFFVVICSYNDKSEKYRKGDLVQ